MTGKEECCHKNVFNSVKLNSEYESTVPFYIYV